MNIKNFKQIINELKLVTYQSQPNIKYNETMSLLNQLEEELELQTMRNIKENTGPLIKEESPPVQTILTPIKNITKKKKIIN